MPSVYRLETKRVREPQFPYPSSPLTCTTEVTTFARSLQESDIEKMVVCYLDNMNKLIGIHIVTGTINQAAVFPREVLKHAILWSASAVILIHNHPSGNLRPSDQDINMTKQLKEALKFIDILIHDHMIITEDKIYSFREEGIL